MDILVVISEQKKVGIQWFHLGLLIITPYIFIYSILKHFTLSILFLLLQLFFFNMELIKSIKYEQVLHISHI